MLSCLRWQIHGYCGGERRLALFLSRGISLPCFWPRKPKDLFFVQPTKENLEIFDKMLRKRLRKNSGDHQKQTERLLGRQLVTEMPHPLAQKYPYLYLYEWGVQYGPEAGQGDFVFAFGDGHFAIVEVKDIGDSSRKRKLVGDQARRYAVLFRLAADEAGVQLKSVIAFTYTKGPAISSSRITLPIPGIPKDTSFQTESVAASIVTFPTCLRKPEGSLEGIKSFRIEASLCKQTCGQF
eukprot:s507_g8.t1